MKVFPTRMKDETMRKGKRKWMQIVKRVIHAQLTSTSPSWIARSDPIQLSIVHFLSNLLHFGFVSRAMIGLLCSDRDLLTVSEWYQIFWTNGGQVMYMAMWILRRTMKSSVQFSFLANRLQSTGLAQAGTFKILTFLSEYFLFADWLSYSMFPIPQQISFVSLFLAFTPARVVCVRPT